MNEDLRARIRAELTVYETCVACGVTPNMHGAYRLLIESLEALAGNGVA